MTQVLLGGNKLWEVNLQGEFLEFLFPTIASTLKALETLLPKFLREYTIAPNPSQFPGICMYAYMNSFLVAGSGPHPIKLHL